MKKLVLLDGNSLLYRAFYSMPLLKNKNNLYTNAVYGFVLMLDKILSDINPEHILVAFDKGKSTFRHKEYKEYKGTRDKTPDELVEQFSYVRKVLTAYGIKYQESEDYEADDIIGSYAKKASSEGYEVIIYSGDKDLTQLASENITIHYTKRGVSEIDYYTVEFIKEKYGLTPKQIVDMKGLMGDKSDNIPGVLGIGEKTAIKLLKEYQSVENILENIENISGKKLKEKLEAGKEDAILSKRLATIFTDIEDLENINNLTFVENLEEKIELFEYLGFSSFLKKLNKKEDKKTELNIIAADKFTTFNQKKLAIHLECFTSDYQKSDVLAISVYDGNNCYIFSKEDFFENKEIIEFLKNEDSKKILYDFKKILYISKQYNVDIKGDIYDIKLANYLLDVTTKDEINQIVENYLFKNLSSDEEIYGKGAKRTLPEKDVFENYIANLTKYLYELKDVMFNLIDELNMTSLYKDIELNVSRVLSDMEINGISVSREKLLEISNDLEERISVIENSIYTLAGHDFNISSPKQLGVVLFEELNLPVIKKTKTGYSTSVEILETLKNEHEIISLIMEYRTLTKLNSTYAKGLIKDIDIDGRIHTCYEQTLTQTGRLSSVNPNLQNIPTRIEEGKKIRKAFVPSSDDKVILSVDYSQIELRVLAHISQDKVMLEAFRNDEDIHIKTASEVNKIAISEVTKELRQEAKAVNFGIVYGISDFGLSTNLGISRKRAKDFIEKYLETFSGIKKYMDDIVNFAKEKEYVETIFNRRRKLQDINSKNKIVANLTKRIAMNTPIQGTAADIIKIAMVKVYDYLLNSKLDAKLLLQVHDELIFEVNKKDLEELEKNVIRIMESVVELDVKLKADSSFGNSWYEAK